MRVRCWVAMGFMFKHKSPAFLSDGSLRCFKTNSTIIQKNNFISKYLHSFLNANKKSAGKSAGFTLIELMVVLTIVAIIMSFAMMNSVIARDKARISACKATMETVKKGMEAYIADNSKYPDQGTINSYNDVILVMKDIVDLTPKITCEEPFVYTSAEKSYRLETQVHYIGSASGGVRIILENGDMTEEPM